MTTSWTGLAAETWDCFGGDEPMDDHEYLRSLVLERPGLVLDVGCGTGRLLVRWLREGLQVHGLDSSADMLAECRAKAARFGLEPQLFHQGMEALEVSHRYATIVVPCGSFMLHLDDRSASLALKRFRQHLAPGGVLVLTYFAPSARPQPPLGVWQRRSTGQLPSGDQVTMDVITDGYDPSTRVIESRRKYAVLQDGEIIREQLLIDRYRWSSPQHAQALLEEAGFRVCSATGDYSSQALDQSHKIMVLQAMADEAMAPI